MTDDSWIDLHRRALAGDTKARDALIGELWSIVHHRVGKTLLTLAPSLRGPKLREELKELMQDVLEMLIKNNWWAFRKWDPSRGRSLPNFVRKFVHWRTVSRWRAKQNDGEVLTDEGSPPDTEDRTVCPEKITATREMVERIYNGARARLTDLGWTMFEMIVIEDLSTDEIHLLTGMPKRNIFVWRNRLRKLIRQLIEEHERVLSPT